MQGSMQAEGQLFWDKRWWHRKWQSVMGAHGLLGALEEWVGLADGEQERRSPDTSYEEATWSTFSPFVPSLLPLSIRAGVPVVPPQLAL